MEAFAFYESFLNDEYIMGIRGFNINPHEQCAFVAVVPNIVRDVPQILNIIAGSPLVNVWALSTLIFTLARVCFRRRLNQKQQHRRSPAAARRRNRPPAQRNQLFYIPFNTFGMSLGTTGPEPQANRSTAERITVCFLSLFAIVSGCFFAGELMQSFAGHVYEPVLDSTEAWSQRTDLRVFIAHPMEKDVEFANVWVEYLIIHSSFGCSIHFV